MLPCTQLAGFAATTDRMHRLTKQPTKQPTEIQYTLNFRRSSSHHIVISVESLQYLYTWFRMQLFTWWCC
jgi:hypothetical protein